MFIFLGNLIYHLPVAISFQCPYSYMLNLILVSKIMITISFDFSKTWIWPREFIPFICKAFAKFVNPWGNVHIAGKEIS